MNTPSSQKNIGEERIFNLDFESTSISKFLSLTTKESNEIQDIVKKAIHDNYNESDELGITSAQMKSMLASILNHGLSPMELFYSSYLISRYIHRRNTFLAYSQKVSNILAKQQTEHSQSVNQKSYGYYHPSDSPSFSPTKSSPLGDFYTDLCGKNPFSPLKNMLNEQVKTNQIPENVANTIYQMAKREFKC